MTIKVLLADDHAMLRDGLQAILERQAEIEVVGACGDGRTALKLVSKLRPDVVVMDIAMPGLNGIEAARQITSDTSGVRVIALSVYADKRYVLNMLDAGASGYLLKLNAHDELLRAVRAVAGGNKYLSPEVAALVIDDRTARSSGSQRSAYGELRSREREVLQLLAEGKTSPQIAQALHISVKTVETHRRNIMKRLGIHSVAELTKYAVREGLTSLD